MKPKPHTKEWLKLARKHGSPMNLTMAKLAELTGLHVNAIQYLETGQRRGTPAAWEQVDKALYPIVPAMFVDEEALLADARAYAHIEGGDAPCCLTYAAGSGNIAFVNVCPQRDAVSDSSCITLSWADAIELLEAQKSSFD